MRNALVDTALNGMWLAHGAQGEPEDGRLRCGLTKQSQPPQVSRRAEFNGERVERDLSMVLEAEGHTRHYFYRTDGTRITALGRPRPARGAVRSHRAPRPLAAGLRRTAVVAGVWITETQQRFDLALAAISALLVAGVIFNAFGLASWLFSADGSTMWTFWLIGIGLWALALSIFFTFMNHPVPRHAKGR